MVFETYQHCRIGAVTFVAPLLPDPSDLVTTSPACGTTLIGPEVRRYVFSSERGSDLYAGGCTAKVPRCRGQQSLFVFHFNSRLLPHSLRSGPPVHPALMVLLYPMASEWG